MKLKYQLSLQSQLNEKDISSMFKLMDENYENLSKEKFLNDLSEKTGVILLINEDSEIRGFSTYQIYEDRDINSVIIYSGDTIIHRKNWGSPELFYGFGSLLHQLMNSQKHGQTIYWFLLSKGYRTYYMLPLFFNTYYPQANCHENPVLKERLRKLSIKKFGDLFNRETGVIEVRYDHLKGDLAEIPDHKKNDEHVRFFLNRNPLYTRGHELACLTEISMDNIRQTAQRFVK